MSGLPIPRGNAPLCACGCGNRTSTIRTAYILGHRPRVPALDRIAGHLAALDAVSCWEWVGYVCRNGYATSSIDGVTMMAHRAVWIVLVGPIPEGLVLDHLCRNRACVNPAHLEPVTQAENVRRSEHLRRASMQAKWAHLTQCPRGHAKSDANTYVNARTGRKSCKPCGRAASLAYYRQKRASA